MRASAGALTASLATSALLAARRGGRAIDASRGEPAFVFEFGGQTLAFVLEGLGTKSMIARAVRSSSAIEPLRRRRLRHRRRDRQRPLLRRRSAARRQRLLLDRRFGLVRPRRPPRRRCSTAGSGPAATPARPGAAASRRRCRGLVDAEEIELAGSAVGALPDGSRRCSATARRRRRDRDRPLISGLHANGASLARLIAADLPDGYGTALPSGATFGAALLDPSVIYSPLVEALLAARRRRPLPQPHHRPRAAEADAAAPRR